MTAAQTPDSYGYPSDWDVARFGDVAQVKRGISWSKEQETWEAAKDVHPVVRIPNIGSKLNLSELLYLRDVPPAQAAKHRAEQGWCLMIGSNGNPDRVGNAVFIAEPTELLFASFLLATAPRNRSRLAPEFLFRWITSHETQARLSLSTAGTTGLKNISLGYLRRLHVPLPPLPEQRKIAAILRSVDEAIERTEAVIAALREVKRGMMQELLTRGIGEDGQIRDPEAHPEEFHETKLGLLPNAWEVVTLAGLGNWHSGGTPSKGNASYWDGDLPWVSPKDMKRPLLDDAEDHISAQAAEDGSRVMPTGTLLVVVRGLILAHSFPVAVITRPMAFNQDIKALVCRNGVLPRFVLSWLTSNAKPMLNLVTDSTHGTKRIDTGGLLSREFPLPPYEEQVSIHGRLAAVDAELEALAESTSILGRLKRGLMQQLLTGKARVRL